MVNGNDEGLKDSFIHKMYLDKWRREGKLDGNGMSRDVQVYPDIHIQVEYTNQQPQSHCSLSRAISAATP